MAQCVSSLIHPSSQTPPLSFEICVTPPSFLFTRVKLLPHTLSAVDLQRERRQKWSRHTHFLYLPVKHQHTVIPMSGLRGDSLTSPCLTHQLFPSLTCCLTDFMHEMNDAQRKIGPTPLLLIPQKGPTSTASISFLILTVRFTVWVV